MNLDLPNFLTDDGALAAAPAGHQGDLLLKALLLCPWGSPTEAARHLSALDNHWFPNNTQK